MAAQACIQGVLCIFSEYARSACPFLVFLGWALDRASSEISRTGTWLFAVGVSRSFWGGGKRNGTLEEQSEQIVSRERVRAHGEVYTAAREVNAMLDLVKPQSEDDGSTFLEPACGDGNFLIEILRRKLVTVRTRFRRSPFDFELRSLLVLGLLYGVDILPDNVQRCRRRLYDEWETTYRAVCKKAVKDDVLKAATFILGRNIVCGNALSMMRVDAQGRDTAEPIVFSEWKPSAGMFIQRTDFTMNELLAHSDAVQKPEVGPDAPKPLDGELLAPEPHAKFPKPVGKPVTKLYRRIWEDAESQG